MSAQALLQRNPDPTIDDVNEALGGNLCRCAGYLQITDAVLAAAKAGKQ
jgi:aerobic-type carbon monoxide dehydrogenase small subunit (CoxS/CutS family)